MKTLGSILKNYKELYAVPADTTVHDAAVYMAERNIGAVTVVDGDRVVGLFSERDLHPAEETNPKRCPRCPSRCIHVVNLIGLFQR